MRRTERGEGERGLRFAGGGGDQNQRKKILIKNEIRCNVSGPKNKEEKYIIYHCIIGISRQPNQGAVDDYFLPYHPKWWKRRGNYQPAADCWVGILMVIIAALMVYLPAYLSHYLALSHRHRCKLMVLFQHSLFIIAQRAPKGRE